VGAFTWFMRPRTTVRMNAATEAARVEDQFRPRRVYPRGDRSPLGQREAAASLCPGRSLVLRSLKDQLFPKYNPRPPNRAYTHPCRFPHEGQRGSRPSRQRLGKGLRCLGKSAWDGRFAKIGWLRGGVTNQARGFVCGPPVGWDAQAVGVLRRSNRKVRKRFSEL
jgi:hypothetical protein